MLAIQLLKHGMYTVDIENTKYTNALYFLLCEKTSQRVKTVQKCNERIAAVDYPPFTLLALAEPGLYRDRRVCVWHCLVTCDIVQFTCM